jgi:hypothetical protein
MAATIDHLSFVSRAEVTRSRNQRSYAYQQLTFQPCSDTEAQSNAVPEEA